MVCMDYMVPYVRCPQKGCQTYSITHSLFHNYCTHDLPQTFHYLHRTIAAIAPEPELLSIISDLLHNIDGNTIRSLWQLHRYLPMTIATIIPHILSPLFQICRATVWRRSRLKSVITTACRSWTATTMWSASYQRPSSNCRHLSIWTSGMNRIY